MKTEGLPFALNSKMIGLSVSEIEKLFRQHQQKFTSIFCSTLPNFMENVKEIQFTAKWNFFDAVFLLIFYNVLNIVCVNIVLSANGIAYLNENTTAEKSTATQSTAEHPLTQLIGHSRTNPSVLLLAFISGVVAAPLVEEFLFRLLLQNAVEKYAGDSPIRNAIIAVTATSLLFAALHGFPRKEIPFAVLQASMTGLIIGGILFLITAVAYLTVFRKTEAKDLGWDKQFIFTDILTAIKYAVFVIPAVMLLHIAAKLLLPDKITDPIPLFFFSLILGYLFYKTHRLAPCIALHAFFNGFNFVILFFHCR